MYNIPYYKENDHATIVQFLHEHPFAFLSGSNAAGEPIATQVPMLIEERDGELFLLAHIMRNTDHHKAFLQNPKALAVFTGAHTYVSASWYTNPHGGSTWNYMSVHAKGEIRFVSDDEFVALMKKLTLHFENNNTNSPTVFDNLPDDYIKKMMPAIVGIEIKIEKLENVFKLSQNRDAESYQNIIKKLTEQGGDALIIAQEMEKRHQQLFHQLT